LAWALETRAAQARARRGKTSGFTREGWRRSALDALAESKQGEMEGDGKGEKREKMQGNGQNWKGQRAKSGKRKRMVSHSGPEEATKALAF
jgi:hypothetical protein